mgnify:CR=1 FL=1
MSILKQLGLTKESMAKMLGPVTAFKDPDPKIPRRWEAVPEEIKEAILKDKDPAGKTLSIRREIGEAK